MIPEAEVLAPLWPHLERCAPAEGCAVLLCGPSGGRLHLMKNVAAAGFAFDDGEWLALQRAARLGGEQVAWIIHSHVDCAPSLSAEDRASARLHPGVDWLVVSLREGRVDACALHRGAGGSRVSGGLGRP